MTLDSNGAHVLCVDITCQTPSFPRFWWQGTDIETRKLVVRQNVTRVQQKITRTTTRTLEKYRSWWLDDGVRADSDILNRNIAHTMSESMRDSSTDMKKSSFIPRHSSNHRNRNPRVRKRPQGRRSATLQADSRLTVFSSFNLNRWSTRLCESVLRLNLLCFCAPRHQNSRSRRVARSIRPRRTVGMPIDGRSQVAPPKTQERIESYSS